MSIEEFFPKFFFFGSQTCVCERQRTVFMKANMGRAVYHLLVYTRYIKVPNMVVISQYIMFTIALWFHAHFWGHATATPHQGVSNRRA